MEESTSRRECAPPTAYRTLRPPRVLSSRLARAAVAVGLGVGLVAGTSNVAHAAEVTAPVPLDELGPGPVSVRLDHGVTASVDAGAWTPPQGYVVFPGQPQTWTFSEPVALRLGVAGLNHVEECVALPVGIAVETIHADHAWDEATREVCRTAAANPAAESVFVLAGPVLDFTWTPVGGGANTGRGPTFLEVTVQRDPAVVIDDVVSTVVGTPTAIDLTANDSIPEGSTGFAVDSTSAQGGTVVDQGDGTVTYTPPAGFVGTDSFTYRVTGPDGVEVSATVTVTVTEDDEPAIPIVAGGLAGLGLLGAAGLGWRRLRPRTES